MRSHYKSSTISSITMALLVLCMSVLPGASSLANPSHDANSASSDFAYPDFKANWERIDGPVAKGQMSRSWLWGPSPGVTVQEEFAQARDGVRTVQYFDKARMELNEDAASAGSQWRVTTGLLVAEMVSGRIQTGEHESVARTPPRK